METKQTGHTPGPYQIREATPEGIPAWIIETETQQIAWVPKWTGTLNNVRLLQHADDMLAALIEFRDDVDAAAGDQDPESWLDVEWPDMASTYQRACTAIAKAEGRG